MMKKFLPLLIICMTMNCVFAETRTVKTYSPLPNNYYNNYYNISQYNYNKIADIEYELFGRDYSGQNIISRIERLENEIFNRQYPNSTPEQRINNLIYSYRQNNSVTSNKTGKLKSIVNGIGSAFFGTPTGYTPPISGSYDNPYYSWGNGGYGQNYGTYSDYYGRNGWHRYGKTMDSNTGVYIID